MGQGGGALGTRVKAWRQILPVPEVRIDSAPMISEIACSRRGDLRQAIR
jgi:hypothetical protein